jgi:hypothetical protein
MVRKQKANPWSLLLGFFIGLGVAGLISLFTMIRVIIEFRLEGVFR